ncbi:DNA mismatch repair endonuclease MutL [Oceanisphaera arctica]|uniref:DNA mismatch repair protein MutL n=1 Tax=Oceanisphaera arctica TaxID=641510 RepID=A0A2P5TJI0_9GAMM|nr:DNA mismatch repair endonuclease MutL [Oceanisphaera arctica]PPL15139.1 DNA mismatch repair protein MutL [Oceanisphaera arctica]GHA06749.1 DNA mismatch repair protein MutL [Oceanisphaera arctica]
MPIQILPARLANQIAAGEVVERPASVVKELVENSLDAGATRIEVDIEKGGAKLIRIRDNGCGIGKDELTLALSRHATSKVSTLEDLEQILSLGFRGEALASISSVSRLTLTSRPAEQSEAWQAMASGRDMEVKLQPASHPQGTTLEASDLFFNTPARRKFMRTEKTEFSHIDEVIRRIALSRFDVDLVLRHNGKQVRQYRAGRLPSQQDKRLAAVCGPAFMNSALKLDSEHHGLRLWGWLAPPSAARAQPDVQYTYVNGRMMRDKLLNHAVRQAYGDRLPAEGHAAFVLYLELDAREVDVNVHPAKHEVRFHQSRLVHDFICQVLLQVLERQQLQQPRVDTDTGEVDEPHQATTSRSEYPDTPREPVSYQAPRHGYGGGMSARESRPGAVSRGEWQGIDSLLTTLTPTHQSPTHPVPSHHSPSQSADTAASQTANVPSLEHGQPLLLIKERGLVVLHRQGLWLCDLNRARAYADGLALFEVWQQGLTPQPLLLPIRLALDSEQQTALERHQVQLQKLGLELKNGASGTIILTRVPQPLRHADLARLFPELLAWLDRDAEPWVLCQWLAEQGNSDRQRWSMTEAMALWQQLQPTLPDMPDEVPFLQPVAIEQQLDRWIDGD